MAAESRWSFESVEEGSGRHHRSRALLATETEPTSRHKASMTPVSAVRRTGSEASLRNPKRHIVTDPH